ncbi:MAG TPA: type II secretion system F family protein [Gemmataceae bacterium]|nr:type II secretion system F family protein [Gemmataceae bacterium]
MFRSPYSYDALATWCRAIRHGHGAGLPLVKVFQMQARNGPAALREAAGRIARKLEAGTTLEEALTAEGELFPELFTAMASLGDQTGHVPEVFGELEEYFRLQHSMRRDFRAQAAWPVFQFVAAVLVIALTIFIMGILAESRNTEPTAPIGFGLTGTSGAILFLVVVGSVVGGLFLAYHLLTKTVAKRAAFEAWLLKWPVVGPCVQAAAMSRFCLSLKLTLDSNLSIKRALRMSLRATGNGAFSSQADRIVKRLEKGDELNKAVSMIPAIPPEFLAALTVGEVSGQVPEVMAKQSEYYREETVRRSKFLTRAMGWGVYSVVGIFIIVAIFLMAGVYLKALGG